MSVYARSNLPASAGKSLSLQIFCENIDFLTAKLIESDTGKKNAQKVTISITILNFPVISVWQESLKLGSMKPNTIYKAIRSEERKVIIDKLTG